MSALDAAYAALKADGRVRVEYYEPIAGGIAVWVGSEESNRSVKLCNHTAFGKYVDAVLTTGWHPISARERIALEAIADIAAAWVLEGRLP